MSWITYELEVEDVDPHAGIARTRPDVPSRAYATTEIGVALGEAIEHGRSARYRVRVGCICEDRVPLELGQCERRYHAPADPVEQVRHHCVSIRDGTIREGVVLVGQGDGLHERRVAGDVGEEEKAARGAGRFLTGHDRALLRLANAARVTGIESVAIPAAGCSPPRFLSARDNLFAT